MRWSTKSHINEIQMIGKNDMIHKRECHQAVMSALFPLLVCSARLSPPLPPHAVQGRWPSGLLTGREGDELDWAAYAPLMQAEK